MKPRSSRMRRKSERKLVMLAVGCGLRLGFGRLLTRASARIGTGSSRVAEFRTAIGLMSGTSLDGVDVALLDDRRRARSRSSARRGPIPMPRRTATCFRQAFARRAALTDRDARPGVLAEAEALVTLRHAEAVEAFLAASGIDAPSDRPRRLPRPDRVPRSGARADGADRRRPGARRPPRRPGRLGFSRRRHGGGRAGRAARAGLPPRARRDGRPRTARSLFLNLGGVANITYVGADGELIAFDTGPGNALLDDWTLRAHRQAVRRDGRLAASGTPSAAILDDASRPPLFRAAAAEIARPQRLFARRAWPASPTPTARRRCCTSPRARSRRRCSICRRRRAPGTPAAADGTTPS